MDESNRYCMSEMGGQYRAYTITDAEFTNFGKLKPSTLTHLRIHLGIMVHGKDNVN